MRASSDHARALQGWVVVHAPEECDSLQSHERASRAEITRRLAVLTGFEFAGEHDGRCRYSDSLYFVPSRTLLAETAHGLGITGEQDLFGGVVPHAFVATKAITHPLVGPDAPAPLRWSPEFCARVRDSVLAGFTAFSHDEARRAGRILLNSGPVRVKLADEAGGRG